MYLNDCIQDYLLGEELSKMHSNFSEISDVFKEQNHRECYCNGSPLILWWINLGFIFMYIYTVEPPLTETLNSGHLPYRGQQSMYQLLFS